jgi:hypothetical protein
MTTDTGSKEKRKKKEQERMKINENPRNARKLKICNLELSNGTEYELITYLKLASNNTATTLCSIFMYTST